jgi:hypothetical protein
MVEESFAAMDAPTVTVPGIGVRPTARILAGCYGTRFARWTRE